MKKIADPDVLSAEPATIATDDVAVGFDAVTKKFGDSVALDAVSLSIKRGEFMTLLGPSGCGKTTLLNLAAGFFSPDSGEISINGERVNDVPAYQRGIGIMFQNYALFPHMSVASNIAYGLKVRHVSKSERERRVNAVLSLVKLTGLQDRMPRQLSGGQQQRVALARALVINPAVLLLDEPFSALDKNLRAAMQVELRDIQRKLGVTTLFVTHDQGEALSMSDRVAVMSQGRIRQLGTPADVYRRPSDRFVASFVGDANILRGRLEQKDGSSAIVSIGAARVTVPSAPLVDVALSSPVDLFVRPEQLKIGSVCEPCATNGTVTAQVYQGGHVDIYVASEASARDLLIRTGQQDALSQWRIGTKVDVQIAAGDGVAFSANGDAR